MAGDFSTVNVILGGGAQNQVVTEAGVYFIQGTLGPNGTPWWVYDGTNLVGNVPTGKGFAFYVNGVSQANISSAGVINAAGMTTQGAGSFTGYFSALTGFTWSNGSTTITQSATNGLTINDTAATTNVLDLQKSGLRKMVVDTSGNLTVSGILTSSGVNFGNVGTAPANSQAAAWYDGTNLVGNVPTGKGFQWTVNAGQVFAVSSLGVATMAHVAGGSAAVVPGDPASVGRVTIGLGAGTTSSGTAVTASGHDMAMRVGVTLNSTGTVSQPILLGSWAASYNRPPFITESPGNAATAAIAVAQAPFLQTTTSGWSIIANTTGLSAGTYVWYLSGVVQ